MDFIKITIAFLLVISQTAYALDQSFFSIKTTEAQPISDNFWTPSGSINFDSNQLQELMYSSPDNKKFSFQASALISDDNDIHKLRAFLSFDGIVFTTSSGKVSGNFKATDSSYFPNQASSEMYYNNDTLLPSSSSFTGTSEFIGIGKANTKNIIFGVGYRRTVAPQQLSIKTNQSLLSSSGSYGSYGSTGYSGAYPSSAIDGEGEIIIYGLWIRYDPLREAFEKAQNSKKSTVKFFYFYDALIGNFEYNPGNKVSQDYADATEYTATQNGNPGGGTTLKVSGSKSSLLNMVATYGAGIHAIYPVRHMLVGISAGIERNFYQLDDVDVSSSSSFNDDYAEGRLNSGTSSTSNGVFLRLAITY